jgi:hypothetical protein
MAFFITSALMVFLSIASAAAVGQPTAVPSVEPTVTVAPPVEQPNSGAACPANNPTKVMVHYMLWFNEAGTNGHWQWYNADHFNPEVDGCNNTEQLATWFPPSEGTPSILPFSLSSPPSRIILFSLVL